MLQALTVGIQRFYSPVLHRALDRPKIWLTVLLALTLLSIPIIKLIGTSLFPPAETPQFLIRIDMPQGTSLRTTDQTVRLVEERLATVPEVAWYSSNVGRGNPQVYYNVGQKEVDSAFGEVAVSLKEWDSKKSEHLLEELRQGFATIPGARVSIVTFVNGPEIEAPIVLRLLGPDLDTLRNLAAHAENSLNEMAGLRDINSRCSKRSIQPLLALRLTIDLAPAISRVRK